MAERRLWPTGNWQLATGNRQLQLHPLTKRANSMAQWDAPRINGRFVPLLAIAVV